jgi:hypothetical protein
MASQGWRFVADLTARQNGRDAGRRRKRIARRDRIAGAAFTGELDRTAVVRLKTETPAQGGLLGAKGGAPGLARGVAPLVALTIYRPPKPINCTYGQSVRQNVNPLWPNRNPVRACRDTGLDEANWATFRASLRRYNTTRM